MISDTRRAANDRYGRTRPSEAIVRNDRHRRILPARRFFSLRYWGAYLSAKYGSSIRKGGEFLYSIKNTRQIDARCQG
jgi:hypothetical protein